MKAVRMRGMGIFTFFVEIEGEFVLKRA